MRAAEALETPFLRAHWSRASSVSPFLSLLPYLSVRSVPLLDRSQSSTTIICSTGQAPRLVRLIAGYRLDGGLVRLHAYAETSHVDKDCCLFPRHPHFWGPSFPSTYSTCLVRRSFRIVRI
jgi:hypothetical protein